ncbi:MAG: DMT family transporter [Rhodospirillaceae bacterium]|nr:DMT family transporter [Rhodospirillaceae bacterium]MBT5839297.1 DMT family transporter [Rhodospirillaceae bacterium]MBT6289077.1 DMT family transporter [Rhodospirillaceae bacterium]MBT7234387.1 DMT family transporter [Rhodospirillaceae bacterium]
MDANTKRYYWAVGLSLLAAIGYALNSSLAAVSYSHGASPLSVLTTRTIVGALGLYLILKIKKIPLKLSVRDMAAAAGLGVFFTLSAFSILSAFQFIPVALAVLIFYLFPLLTAIGAWAFFRQPLRPLFVAMLIVALVGLALALNTGADGLDIKGVLWAAAGAVVVACFMLLNGKLVQGKDARPYALAILSSAAVMFVIASLIVGEFPLPETGTGLAAFFGVAAAHASAFTVMFIALSMVGPVRVSLFLNFEPVATIILGVLLLGQVLAPLQLAGAGIVIAAVIIAGRQKIAEAATD